MHYMNPFDFVPLPETGPKHLPVELLKGPRLEGYITYSIKTLTPLHITGRTTKSGSHFQTKYFNENYGRKVIPGASIRGMLSAFVEALTGSDLRSFTRGNESGEPYAKKRGRHVGFLMAAPNHDVKGKNELLDYRPGRYRYERHETLPPNFGKQEAKDIASYLFGFVPQEDRPSGVSDEKKAPMGGRIFFEDIRLADNINTFFPKAWDLDSPAIMGGPNPRANTAWYFTPGECRVRVITTGSSVTRVWEVLADRVRGRKFYFHQYPEPCHTKYSEWENWMNTIVEYQVEAIPEGVTIDGGRIDFTDLPESLLTILAYSIGLEPGMAHKLGALKPFGYGSIALEIKDLCYRNMKSPLDTIQPQDLKGNVNPSLMDISAYNRLKLIHHFPEIDEREHYLFLYPPFNPDRHATREKRGFALPEIADSREEPSKEKHKKLTLFFDHYQETSVNYKKVMGG